MKKKHIIAVVVLLLVLLPAMLYVTRNEWVAFGLKRTVASRSQGQIALDFKNIDVIAFSRTLVIYEPELRFNQVYFNKAAGTTLEKAIFQKLVLTNISLWDVLLHKQFIIDNLLLEKPAFILGKRTVKTKTKTADFDPASLIEVMQNHEVAHLRFQFLVRHTQINFGKLELSGKKGADIYGSALYNFSIENMGTIRAAGDTLHSLTFDKLELVVRNFYRHSGPEKMDVSLDSAFYSSQGRTLFLRGLHVDLLDKNLKKPPVARINLRWISISGLNTKKQKKAGKPILHFNEIKVVGGSLILKQDNPKKAEKSTSSLLKGLFSAYHVLSLDTLNLKHLHLYQLDKRGDTLMKVKRLNVKMQKLWANKRILDKPLAHLHYEDLQTSYQEFVYGNKLSRLQIRSGKAQFNSRSNQLVFSDLFLKTRCNSDSSLTSSFGVQRFSVGNLSDKKLQKNKRQLIAVNMVSPFLDLKQDSSCTSGFAVLPDFLQPLRIEKIHIENGKVEYESNHNLRLNLMGINLFADSLMGTKLNGPQAGIHYDSLFFSATGSRLSVANKNEILQTGKLVWDNNSFRLTGLRFSQNDSLAYDTLQIGWLTLTKPHLNPLLFRKTLVARGAYLYKANFSYHRQDSTGKADTLRSKHWNSYFRLPFKTKIAYIRIRKSQFTLVSRQPDKNFEISSRLALKLHGFKMGYDTTHLISQPKRWEATLQKTSIRKDNLTLQSEKIDLSSDSGTLHLQGVLLKQQKDTSLQFHIRIPDISVQSINYATLMRSDSLIFGKAVMQSSEGKIRFTDFVPDTLNKKIQRWHFVYDSLKFSRTQLTIDIETRGELKTVSIGNLNLLYHPNMRYPDFFGKARQNLIKHWDFTLDKVIFSDLQRKFKIVADRVALQSASSRLNVKKIIGTNFSPEMVDPDYKKVFSYFLISDMSLNDMLLKAGKTNSLYIKHWFVPAAWINIINNDSVKKKRSLAFLNSNFFSRYTRFLSGVHVDSSIFKNVNISYQYDRMDKMVNVVHLAIKTSDIQLGKPFLPTSASNALFGTMFINLNDRSIISGDSMYTFRMRDIRINLPERKIRLDSITLTPRFNRKDFFARAGYQTDRITLYGKNAVLDNFNPDDLLNQHFIHFGNLRLNNLSLRFERDMHYPRRDVIKPMPIDLLNRIPYRFRIDSVQLSNSMISYFEYEVKSKNPGIFFIDNFNVLAQNMTNHLMPDDSNLVLNFKGSGKLMKQADLDFTLVMPYFAPHRQWWFSAEAGKLDLTQFNPMTENVLGISIISGKGSLQVPMITGDETYARGNVDFLYRKLKLRLYSRKKSQQSKGVLSPFANFMMNSIMVKSNNPPFLGHTKKGIVYFERVQEKSFFNYLWKSNLSGILSTIGFNNKQQREVKREDKKQTKVVDKSDRKPEKKP